MRGERTSTCNNMMIAHYVIHNPFYLKCDAFNLERSFTFIIYISINNPNKTCKINPSTHSPKIKLSIFAEILPFPPKMCYQPFSRQLTHVLTNHGRRNSLNWSIFAPRTASLSSIILKARNTGKQSLLRRKAQERTDARQK